MSPKLFSFTHFRKNASATPLVSHTFKTKDLKPFRFIHFQKKGRGGVRAIGARRERRVVLSNLQPHTSNLCSSLTPLDSALTSKRAAKSFTSITYEKHTQGEGFPWGQNTNHESPVTNHESRTYPQSCTAPLSPEHPTGVKYISPRSRVSSSMATAVLVSKKPKEKRSGLSYWMRRVVKEADRVRADF